MGAGTITRTLDDDVAHLLIDRPSHKNAVTLEMMRALASNIAEAQERRCRVLRVGAVGEDFAVGRDHNESPLANPPGSTPDEWVSTAGAAFEALGAFTGISVVEARGLTFGFGAAFAATADICIAASTARFAFDEVPKGFPPKLVMSGMVGRLPTRVLLDLVVTGRSISAQEALQIGMVTQVVDPHVLRSAADDLVATLLRNDERSVRESKRFIKELDALGAPGRAARSIVDRAKE